MCFNKQTTDAFCGYRLLMYIHNNNHLPILDNILEVNTVGALSVIQPEINGAQLLNSLFSAILLHCVPVPVQVLTRERR